MKIITANLGGRKRRTMRGGLEQPACSTCTFGGRKRRTMRGGGRIVKPNLGGRKRRTMRWGGSTPPQRYNPFN